MTNANSVVNPVKELLKAGKIALGMNVRLARTGDIARIAKSSGHDFILIDIQHSLFDVESIGHMAQAALGCGIAPMVRVRSCDDPDASVLLDNGVTGIVFPDISTADQARRAVSLARFAPIGQRSVSGSYSIFDFRPPANGDVATILNDNTIVACMIETQEGLDNIDAIAAVDGIDVIHVGSADLLMALGKPGAFGCPEHIAALDRVITIARKHGKIAGVGGDRNVSRQAEFIRKGARFIPTNSEIAFILAEGSRVTRELRNAIT